jgi:hypothetical protein
MDFSILNLVYEIQFGSRYYIKSIKACEQYFSIMKSLLGCMKDSYGCKDFASIVAKDDITLVSLHLSHIQWMGGISVESVARFFVHTGITLDLFDYLCPLQILIFLLCFPTQLVLKIDNVLCWDDIVITLLWHLPWSFEKDKPLCAEHCQSFRSKNSQASSLFWSKKQQF